MIKKTISILFLLATITGTVFSTQLGQGLGDSFSKINVDTITALGFAITPLDITDDFTISTYSVVIASPTDNKTVTLPPAADLAGKMVYVHNKSTNHITVDTNGSELIHTTDTVKLWNNNSTLQVISDGSNWYPLNTHDFPKQATIFYYNAHVTSGNDMSVVISTNNIFNHLALQSLTVSDGDTNHHHVTLAEGYYDLEFFGQTNGNRGIVDFYLDDVFLFSSDWYDVTTTDNFSESQTIYVPYNGTHELKLVVNGKNGSSSDYVVVYTVFFFHAIE